VCDGGVIESETQVLDAVKIALIRGSDVNAVNKAGDTALHSAASLGFDSVVRLLADNGANVNVKNKRGQTPLGTLIRARGPADSAVGDAYAAASGKQSTVDLLRTLGGE
jgi:hypothetical protein